MTISSTDLAGDDLDLRQVFRAGERRKLQERARCFGEFMDRLEGGGRALYRRCIGSAADREVEVLDPCTKQTRRMLMFGSNNYLGLANHPHVLERTERAIREYGAGLGGPPLLNGYTGLHRELEERIAALKRMEDALLFSSGYAANVGLVSGLTRPVDRLVYDAYSHASLWDGIRMAGVPATPFPHNDTLRLRRVLQRHAGEAGVDVFVCVEGVYSMDGDVAPLDRLVPLCREFDATLVVDDAHGTGVLGESGRGTAEHFGVEGEVPVTLGTFSKAFAATGGFVAATRTLVNYLRYFARSYMFSASLPPTVAATVLAGLDVLEREPWRRVRLRENVARLARGLRALGFDVRPQAGIVPLRVPAGMNLRDAARKFHELGIFLNAVEYPAVQASQQRFRVSLMATHRDEDIDRLLAAVEEVWSLHAPGGLKSPASHDERKARAS